jgi:Cytidylyltransferase-like
MGDLLDALMRGERTSLRFEPDGSVRADAPAPSALMPGSFNPLHDGHTALASVASRVLGLSVAYELSLANVDKPDLNVDEVTRRLEAFRGVAPVWITRAATFERKAALFPGCAFVVGFDTAIRLVDAKYYGDDPIARDAALRNLLSRGCRFVVGGRRVGDAFRTWNGEAIAPEFRALFATLGEDEFRVDRSSTEMRAK